MLRRVHFVLETPEESKRCRLRKPLHCNELLPTNCVDSLSSQTFEQLISNVCIGRCRLDTYSHVLPDMQEEAARRIEKVLFGKMSA